jgi:hypothetical protein
MPLLSNTQTCEQGRQEVEPRGVRVRRMCRMMHAHEFTLHEGGGRGDGRGGEGRRGAERGEEGRAVLLGTGTHLRLGKVGGTPIPHEMH